MENEEFLLSQEGKRCHFGHTTVSGVNEMKGGVLCWKYLTILCHGKEMETPRQSCKTKYPTTLNIR